MRSKTRPSTSSTSNFSQQRDQRLQQDIMLREKLFTDTYTNIQLKQMNLTDEETVIEKQRKRLGVSGRKLTLQQLSFGAISNSNNLFNLIRDKKAKIIDVKATRYEIKITVQTDRYWTVSLQSGTLLYPAKKESNQTLIISNSISADLKPGVNQLKAKTFCYNNQLSSPHNEPYLLGSIKCLKHDTSMDQFQVWEITVKKKDQLKHYQGKVEKQERMQYIAITKTKILQILQAWQ